jgi:hypothetical protein
MRDQERLKELTTTSTYITEEKRTHFGLDLPSLIVVIAIFFVIEFLFHQFPASLGSGLLVAFIVRRYLSNKPRLFLPHFGQWLVLPKHYFHRCRPRRSVLADGGEPFVATIPNPEEENGSPAEPVRQ